jgi:hypothetical protein
MITTYLDWQSKDPCLQHLAELSYSNIGKKAADIPDYLKHHFLKSYFLLEARKAFVAGLP